MKYCGRDFTEEEIALIKKIVSRKPEHNRYTLSKIICKNLQWYKHDGGLKDMSCRVAMLRMESDGLFVLPKPIHKNSNGKKYLRCTAQSNPGTPSNLPIDKLEGLEISIVSLKEKTSLWNEYINRYHYLGHKPLPGANLKYFVYCNNQIVALLGFGAAAWKVLPRDNFIGWTSEQRMYNLHLIVNNARFLILPWINSKNLASKILSLIAKRITYDWYERYKYTPVLLETFVEKQRFYGTCYKAANWIYLGTTKGRGKLDRFNEYKLPIKDILIFPLQKKFKQILCSG